MTAPSRRAINALVMDMVRLHGSQVLVLPIRSIPNRSWTQEVKPPKMNAVVSKPTRPIEVA